MTTTCNWHCSDILRACSRYVYSSQTKSSNTAPCQIENRQTFDWGGQGYGTGAPLCHPGFSHLFGTHVIACSSQTTVQLKVGMTSDNQSKSRLIKQHEAKIVLFQSTGKSSITGSMILESCQMFSRNNSSCSNYQQHCVALLQMLPMLLMQHLVSTTLQ